MTENIPVLKAPGIPLNLDVSLLAMVYIGIGFFCKKRIKCIEEKVCITWDVVGFVCAVSMAIFCWLNYKYDWHYYFDMKSVYYKELILAILIPCGFGMALLRVAFWISRLKALNLIKFFFLQCGKATIPIMFMHLPLNNLKESANYSIVLYVVIGVGIPLLLSWIFGNVEILRKLFGFPLIEGTLGVRHEKLGIKRRKAK